MYAVMVDKPRIIGLVISFLIVMTKHLKRSMGGKDFFGLQYDERQSMTTVGT